MTVYVVTVIDLNLSHGMKRILGVYTSSAEAKRVADGFNNDYGNIVGYYIAHVWPTILHQEAVADGK